MATLNIDINNKCRNNRCKCKVVKRAFISTSVGAVEGAKGFGYCTHTTNGNYKVHIVTWKSYELERVGGGLRPFEDSESITVFYYSKRVFNGAIKKPLLIRAKRYGHTHWYENVGGYDNKRWKKIDNEVVNDEYPTEDNYYGKNYKFLHKLKGLACRLHVSHGIYISDKYDIKCNICGKSSEITRLEDRNIISGYKRYRYEGFIGNSVIVYKGRQLTFRKRSLVTGFGYYLPIPVDVEDFSAVSTYYWEGDSKLENPLLIEFVGRNGISYWIENITSPDKYGNYKHDKWKPIWKRDPNKLGNDIPEIKERLEILNCIYNKTVQINISKSEDCHPKDHILHKDRIDSSYGEVEDTHPLLYAYTYKSSVNFPYGSFNISEIYTESIIQNFQDNLPFMNVTSFIAYVSPCFKNKPFLICVESNESTSRDYHWYCRRKEYGPWEKYNGFSGNSREQSPEKVKKQIIKPFLEVKDLLKIGKCHISTSKDGIKLDIKQIPYNKYSSLTYYDKSSTKDNNVSIIVTRAEKIPVLGFFKNSHKPATDNDTFVVSGTLEGGNTIGTGKKTLEGVEDFNVYFWDGEPGNPILLEVKQITEEKKYYGKHGSFWSLEQMTGLKEQQALDHQTCKLHGAIPIDLKTPEDLYPFHFNNSKSTCLRGKFLNKSLPQPDLPQGASGTYIGQGYQIPIGVKISRVTYNYQPTDIIPPYNEKEPTIHIYSWRTKSEVPLLVEFITNSGYEWYENISKGPTYKEWRKIHENISDEFYDNRSINPKLNENFTKRINQVNCKTNDVVQLDISKIDGKYCHGQDSGHNKRIEVAKEVNVRFTDYTGYEHVPKDRKTITISSILNNGYKQKVDDEKIFPLQEVSKVTVHLPNCLGGVPVAIRIEYKKSGGSTKEETWLKRTSIQNQWKEDTQEFSGKDETTIKSLLDTIRTSTDACNQPFPQPTLLPHSLGQVSVDDDNIFGLNDIFDTSENVDENENILDNDEEEDEEIRDYTADSTFVKDYVSSSTKLPAATRVTTVDILPSQASIPGVTVDIKQGITGSEYNCRYEVPQNSGEFVDLEKDDPPGFYIFTHKTPNGDLFKVKKVIYGLNNDDKDEIRPKEPIRAYSVFYWDKDASMNEPLLVEIDNGNNKYNYHSSKGQNQWSPVLR